MPAMTFKATTELIHVLQKPLLQRIDKLEAEIKSLTKPEKKIERSKKKSNKPTN